VTSAPRRDFRRAAWAGALYLTLAIGLAFGAALSASGTVEWLLLSLAAVSAVLSAVTLLGWGFAYLVYRRSRGVIDRHRRDLGN